MKGVILVGQTASGSASASSSSSSSQSTQTSGSSGGLYGSSSSASRLLGINVALLSASFIIAALVI
jgi:hypothetical protein